MLRLPTKSGWSRNDRRKKISAHKYTDEPLVLVAAAPNEPIALMWAEILENEGVHNLIKRQQDLVITMYVGFTFPGCEIYVLASQAEKAREILAPFLEGSEGGEVD